jgi:tRNA1(Val) A37 N6-methylase TrmN6
MQTRCPLPLISGVFMTSLTKLAHGKIAGIIDTGDRLIDATAGNGFDTLFLAQQTGASGKVYAFDIQPQAITNTRQKLIEYGLSNQVELFCHSHADMQTILAQNLKNQIRVVMFNLGYLPGSDKSCITQTDSTLAALHQAGELLMPGGLLSVMLYPGHAGGELEATAVMQWSAKLPANYTYTLHETPGPQWLCIEKHPAAADTP